MATIGGHFTATYSQTLQLPLKIPTSDLAKAVEANDVESVRLLLQKRPKSAPSFLDRASDGSSLISVAAKWGYSEIVDLLLANDRALENKTHKAARDHHYGQALKWAAGEGHMEVVYSLCAALDSVDFRADRGDTALMDAVSGGHLLLVNALLFYGADINAVNIDGDTPLTIAVARQNVAMVHALLAHEAHAGNKGVDIGATGFGGLKAMELAVIMRSVKENQAGEIAEDIVQALRLAGAVEADKSVAEIFQAAALRIEQEALDAQTLRLMDELDVREVKGGIDLHKTQIDQQEIRSFRSQWLDFLKMELQIT